MGTVPKTFIADAGYWSEDNSKACEDRGVDSHIATGRLPHGQPPPPIYGPIPKDLDAKGRMARKLRKRKERRSTPDAKRSRSRFLVRSRNVGV